MRIFRVLLHRIRSIFLKPRADAELHRELAFHLDQLTAENIAAGMSPEDAGLAARRALGCVALLEDQCRDHRRITTLTDLYRDLTYAGRMLRKSPGFTALAIFTLAFGVGASIAVYALAESLMVRSLPYPSPERLVAISSVHAQRESSGVGQANFRDWQSANTVFERMAFTEFSQVTLTGFGDAERITGRAVSEGFFEMIGVAPQLGRWFTPDEQKPGAAQVVLLSHGFWTRKFGSRPDVVGQSITIADRSYWITGVMPDTFRFNEGTLPEYWTPIAYRATGRQQHQYSAYARLKPGVSLEQAQVQLSGIARRLEAAFPENAGWGVGIQSLRASLLEPFGPALRIFAVAALVVLLVACGNVASLLLARGSSRTKEIAVRMALGAGRRRVVRLLLTESLLLSSLGAMAGLVLAFWLLRLAVAAAPPWLQLDAMIAVSPTLAAFSVGLTLVTGLCTGFWPAVRGARADLQNDLKESGTGLVAGRRQVRALNGLVVMEIALAVVLLTFAGLLAKSFLRLMRADLGYRADHLLTFRMPLPAPRYRDDAARRRFWDTLLADLQSTPGIVSAAASDSIPLGGTYSGSPVEIEGRPAPRDWTEATTRGAAVTPSYFATLGIPLRSGRGFNSTDTRDSEPVAIVSEAFQRKLLSDADPVGARIRVGKDHWARIVGVIGDARYNGPAHSAEPEVYRPHAQDAWLQFVAVRTEMAEESVLPVVRARIRALDALLPITQVRMMRQSVDRSTTIEREMTVLVVGFALITLAMSTLGLGGVMAYTVSTRRREIGLRMALGARAIDIKREILGNAARLVVIGAAIGIVCAIAGARVLESLLYGVRPRDPAVVAAAPVLLAVVALVACLAPARRAAASDPMSALRQE